MDINKITDEEIRQNSVVGMAEVPGLPAEEMQYRIEQLVREIAIPKINEVVEYIVENTLGKLLKGKKVAVVDEAIFTGTTLKVVCEMLWSCGVERVYVCIPTPISKHMCQQYIQPERELIIDKKMETFKHAFHLF